MATGDVEFHFEGKNFMVVGASSGLGRQIAAELADAGATVLAVARSRERLAAVQQAHSTVEIATLDVTTAGADDWQNMLKPFASKYGKLDGVVYTAGISRVTSLTYFDEAEVQQIMDTSYWGAVRCLQASTKKRLSNQGASYVFFSSVAALSAQRGLFAYGAAKAALIAGMASLAHDIARDGKRVNTVAPALVRTPMTEAVDLSVGGLLSKMADSYLLGIGEPEDVSGLVLFLLSSRASWITGQNFIVDGGSMVGAHS